MAPDYGTWERDDGMPEQRAMNNRDLPRRGDADQRALDAGAAEPDRRRSERRLPWRRRPSAVDLGRSDRDALGQTRRHRRPDRQGRRHADVPRQLVHGSAGTSTPYPGKIVYLTLNAVSNYIRTPPGRSSRAPRFRPASRRVARRLLRLARAHRRRRIDSFRLPGRRKARTGIRRCFTHLGFRVRRCASAPE